MRFIPIIALALFGALTPAPAQDSARPQELDELRKIYLRQRDELRAEKLQTLVGKLTVLEQSLTENGDPDGAAQVRAALSERRRQLASLSPSVEIDTRQNPRRDPPGTVTFYPSQAHVAGSLRRSRSTLYNWTSQSCIATWSTRDFPAGRYDVYLNYNPLRGGGGQIEVRDLHQTALVTIPPYRDDQPNATSVKAATFDLRTSISLRITPKVRNRNGLFSLRSVRLVHVTPTAGSR